MPSVLTVLIVIMAVTLFSQPIHQQQSGTIKIKLLEDSYYNWFDNPCGVIRQLDQSVSPYIDKAAGSRTIRTFLLQLMITLNRIEYWIDNFVIKLNKAQFFLLFSNKCDFNSTFLSQQTDKKFRSLFTAVEAVDEGVHFAWLLVASTIPNKTHSMNDNYQNITVSLCTYNCNYFFYFIHPILIKVGRVDFKSARNLATIRYRLGTGDC